MTHNPSRKQFFAKLLGAVATASLLPKALAQSTDASMTSTPGSSPKSSHRFEIRTDARAVARRDAV